MKTLNQELELEIERATHYRDEWQKAAISLKKICAQRDELVAALEHALPIVDAYRKTSLGDGDLTAEVMREALAKVMP